LFGGITAYARLSKSRGATHKSSNLLTSTKQTNNHMDEFTLLETKIESLKKEIEDNPDYSQNIKDSILDDIAYYQNHLDHLNDTL